MLYLKGPENNFEPMVKLAMALLSLDAIKTEFNDCLIGIRNVYKMSSRF